MHLKIQNNYSITYANPKYSKVVPEDANLIGSISADLASFSMSTGQIKDYSPLRIRKSAWWQQEMTSSATNLTRYLNQEPQKFLMDA